jgi:hypothetical protein
MGVPDAGGAVVGASTEVVDLDAERAALIDARAAVADKLVRLAGISGGGADALADEYIDAVVRGTVERLQQELVVFGRIDDDHPWRVGLYGIDRGGEQLVIDWRAPFAGGFYQARLDDPMGLERRVTYVGSIDDLFVEDFASGEVTGTSPLLRELSRSRGTEMRAAVATLQSEQDELVRLDPTPAWCCAAGPAPARPWWRCTGPPGSSTTTPASPPAGSSWSARPTGSCGSSRPCCPPWARPASPRPPSSACSARRPRRAATSAGSTPSTASTPPWCAPGRCGPGVPASLPRRWPRWPSG